ncbi:50S ribosomal protein 5, chloroplastic [Salvia miltiorrhiza]|uniref:50S ribosomal protein 5, chloroplastic n=1 Tax=Salvia miltiorrhiza TaxID=226208 RepID=UPI0025AD8631|nr:50S ribosomal protein 5, chloroplastic [Salvia miltiorrhiza]
MALLFTSPLSSLSLNSSSTSRISAKPCFRVPHNAVAMHQRSFVGGRIQVPFVLSNGGALIVKASSDIDGTESTTPESPTPASDGKEKSTPVENLPLQSKVQELEQQRLKMKLAKKIRLRRKRLVRKRHLRKKGRWPPSKMKKNKNV